jgi:hypothetical protein
MLTADCQNSQVKGKILGLHSTVFQSAAMETRDLTAEITAKTPKIACNWSSWVNSEIMARKYIHELIEWSGFTRDAKTLASLLLGVRLRHGLADDMDPESQFQALPGFVRRVDRSA